MADASFTWARRAARTRRQRAGMLARRREWLTQTNMAVKEALDESMLAGVEARRRLALAIAGTFCALAAVARSAGHCSED